MKKVIQEQNTPVVVVEECHAESYYGILLSVPNFFEKGFIQRDHSSGRCIPTSIRFNIGRVWSNYIGDNLHDCLNKLMQSDKLQVFQFETAQELFEWLADKPIKEDY